MPGKLFGLVVLSVSIVIVNSISSYGAKMVRLCIASVDPVKLSSQCVMCNRREFPLTAIDCTGMTKMNELISNPLSVQEATCLIYNCRRQVPDAKPEPYHGSVSHSGRASLHPSASGLRSFGMTPPSRSYGESLPITRYSGYGPSDFMLPARGPIRSGALGSMQDSSNIMGLGNGQSYALVPTYPSAMNPIAFGLRKLINSYLPMIR